ncbi:dienelactone hydrolase family protein [Castellaniella caeni]|uniref:dienelactone hydrolase family protein n=1 Tax=Castellaniella caeni TaxID=266123 RepID=UPI00082A71AC|nr:dienelactone hydrolase family protein [Castellaniella caeni]
MDITLTASDGHSFAAYVNGPEDAAAGVVVLPEIFGINPYIRSMVDRYAAQGYRAISPSLFDRQTTPEQGLQLGYSPEDIQRGLGYKRAIHDEIARLDIEAAAAALSGQHVKLLTGYCWGGYLSWRMACLSDTFTAAVCWHGGGIAKHCHDTARIPVQMHFGGSDGSIPLSDVEQIRAAQPKVDIHVYPGAGHSFGRDATPTYHPESAALAWDRTLAFFRQHGQQA